MDDKTNLTGTSPSDEAKLNEALNNLAPVATDPTTPAAPVDLIVEPVIPTPVAPPVEVVATESATTVTAEPIAPSDAPAAPLATPFEAPAPVAAPAPAPAPVPEVADFSSNSNNLVSTGGAVITPSAGFSAPSAALDMDATAPVEAATDPFAAAPAADPAAQTQAPADAFSAQPAAAGIPAAPATPKKKFPIVPAIIGAVVLAGGIFGAIFLIGSMNTLSCTKEETFTAEEQEYGKIKSSAITYKIKFGSDGPQKISVISSMVAIDEETAKTYYETAKKGENDSNDYSVTQNGNTVTASVEIKESKIKEFLKSDTGSTKDKDSAKKYFESKEGGSFACK